MNFNSLVWYSSLAIGDEKNTYVADFLNRSLSKMSIGTVFFAVYFNKEIKVKKKVFRGLTRQQIISKTIKEMIMLCNSFV